MKTSCKQFQNASQCEHEKKLKELSSLKNLEHLNQVIDFEYFCEIFETSLIPVERKGNQAAPAYDLVFIFKILILRRFYDLRDKQTEYQIKDHTNFHVFLGIRNIYDVPSHNIWHFRGNAGEKRAP